MSVASQTQAPLPPLGRDYRGKAVLVTGGTDGIGKATGLAFGAFGAQVYLTHRWGSADEDALRAT